jgi:methionyl aminopeptidase
MSIETTADWEGLRRVGRVVALTLDAMEAAVRPGITTAELDRVAAGVFAAHGAASAPALTYGFPGTVLISVDDEIVHGIPGPRRLRRGDVVKLDVTATLDGYVADAARTVIVEAGDAEAQGLVACVTSALDKALAVVRPGVPVNHIGRAVDAEVRAHGFSVVRGLDGHGVGRAIHEPPSVPNWYVASQRDVLSEGLVITIEPIISAGSRRAVEDADGWTIRTPDRSRAAHCEHTLVVTAAGPVLLTALPGAV